MRAALEGEGIAIESVDIAMIPSTTVPLETPSDAKVVLGLIDALDDHEDVQGVHANFDVPDDVLQTVAG